MCVCVCVGGGGRGGEGLARAGFAQTNAIQANPGPGQGVIHDMLWVGRVQWPVRGGKGRAGGCVRGGVARGAPGRSPCDKDQY